MRARPLRFCPRALRWILSVFLAASTLPLYAADLPPAKAATDYPAVDNHAKEQVAIAAVPFDTAQDCKIFQVDYLKYRFLPIRIIVTNNGDRPISLRDARIFFISANGDRIPAAEPEDVERRVSARDSRGRDIPSAPSSSTPKATPPTARLKPISTSGNTPRWSSSPTPPTTASSSMTWTASATRRCAMRSWSCANCAMQTASSCSFSRFPSTRFSPRSTERGFPLPSLRPLC